MLTVATYNILHGYHAGLIVKNLECLKSLGADAICIQEADPSFKNSLDGLFIKDEQWQITYFQNGIACNLAIAWNTARLTLQSTQTILLPLLEKPSLIQHLQHKKELFCRGALSASFFAGKNSVRITNTHLAWEGGIGHRLAQLNFLCDALKRKLSDYDILGGDFNTFAPAALRSFQKKKIAAILGAEWTDAVPDISYTCDVSFTAPQDSWGPIIKICRKTGLKLRSRLDYIFARNMIVLAGEMLDLPGSDHRPLIATLDLIK